jgi:hypothetical protein
VLSITFGSHESLKAVRFLESGSASAKPPSCKSVGGGSSALRNNGTGVSPMTQAQIDGTTASRDHGLQVRRFGRRAIVNSRRGGILRRLINRFANPKSDFEETLGDVNGRQRNLY